MISTRREEKRKCWEEKEIIIRMEISKKREKEKDNRKRNKIRRRM
jgi:hypothetical protein